MALEEKYNTLSKIFWDYNVKLLPLDKIINKQLDLIDEYEPNLVVTRMLERLD
ncbi:MAG: hypothetical protein KF816_10125 [Melioribacteraceae bacterium]|jgi:2-polyprenyl-3-methyl-5-hydroxy-6-metoxy-1,4-benzoquinol methylase|nr:hypothetical protein [Melioribacteraceae bacterium]